jgi:hypothetical protein
METLNRRETIETKERKIMAKFHDFDGTLVNLDHVTKIENCVVKAVNSITTPAEVSITTSAEVHFTDGTTKKIGTLVFVTEGGEIEVVM